MFPTEDEDEKRISPEEEGSLPGRDLTSRPEINHRPAWGLNGPDRLISEITHVRMDP